MNSTDTSTEKVWYLVYTKPKQEQYAADNLARQDYRVYLPMCKLRRRFRGRLQSVIEPLFPRYIFIQLDKQNDNWAPIRSTYGVSNIVYFGVLPAVVAPQIIADIQMQSGNSGIIEIADKPLEVGKPVRIVEGVFSDFEGIVMRKSGSERVTVLLDFLEKQTEVSISQNELESVE